MADVNFWGRLLILALPPALSLTAVALARRGATSLRGSGPGEFSPGWFWPACFWAGCAASLGLGIFLTQSRGDLLAAFLAVVIWLVLAGGWYRRSLLAAPIVLALLIPLSGIGSRLLTLVAAAPTATVDPSVAERTRLQLAAWEMFKTAPVTGHGVGSYRSLFEGYDRLSNYSAPVRIDVAAHNLYLEQAADVGVLGLLAWAVFVGTVVFALVRCLTRADRRTSVETRFLSIGLLAALIGWLAASVFLHLSDFRALLTLAALAAALDASVRDRPPLPARPEPSTTRRLAGLTAWAVLVLASGVGPGRDGGPRPDALRRLRHAGRGPGLHQGRRGRRLSPGRGQPRHDRADLRHGAERRHQRRSSSSRLPGWIPARPAGSPTRPCRRGSVERSR